MASVDLNAPFAAQDASDNNSKKSMIYTTDDNKKLVVTVNENYGELLGFLDYTAPIPEADRAPDYLRFEMRKIHAVSADGKVRQSFAVGSPTAPIFSEGGTVTVPRKGKSAGLVLAVTGSTGERKSFATAADSGQSSGDST